MENNEVKPYNETIITFDQVRGKGFPVHFHLDSFMQGIILGLVLLFLFVAPIVIFHIQL